MLWTFTMTLACTVLLSFFRRCPQLPVAFFDIQLIKISWGEHVSAIHNRCAGSIYRVCRQNAEPHIQINWKYYKLFISEYLSRLLESNVHVPRICCGLAFRAASTHIHSRQINKVGHSIGLRGSSQLQRPNCMATERSVLTRRWNKFIFTLWPIEWKRVFKVSLLSILYFIRLLLSTWSSFWGRGREKQTEKKRFTT